MVRLMFWRVWHVHNCIVHLAEFAPIAQSIQFMLSYRETLENIAHGSACPDGKGKAKVWDRKEDRRSRGIGGTGATSKWSLPPACWSKVNVDGAFVPQTGRSGIGLIGRDSIGSVIFSAWMEITLKMRKCGRGGDEALCGKNSISGAACTWPGDHRVGSYFFSKLDGDGSIGAGLPGSGREGAISSATRDSFPSG
ncbi:hypothetical protein ACP70R_019580 [Stipagrostis hirtigluma subsp. patula]